MPICFLRWAQMTRDAEIEKQKMRSCTWDSWHVNVAALTLIMTTFHFFGGFWRLAIYGCTRDFIEYIAYITVTGCCTLVIHCASHVAANSASLTACRLIVVVVAYDQSQDVLHMLVPRFRRRVNTLSHWPSWRLFDEPEAASEIIIYVPDRPLAPIPWIILILSTCIFTGAESRGHSCHFKLYLHTLENTTKATPPNLARHLPPLWSLRQTLF